MAYVITCSHWPLPDFVGGGHFQQAPLTLNDWRAFSIYWLQWTQKKNKPVPLVIHKPLRKNLGRFFFSQKISKLLRVVRQFLPTKNCKLRFYVRYFSKGTKTHTHTHPVRLGYLRSGSPYFFWLAGWTVVSFYGWSTYRFFRGLAPRHGNKQNIPGKC